MRGILLHCMSLLVAHLGSPAMSAFLPLLRDNRTSNVRGLAQRLSVSTLTSKRRTFRSST